MKKPLAVKMHQLCQICVQAGQIYFSSTKVLFFYMRSLTHYEFIFDYSVKSDPSLCLS